MIEAQQLTLILTYHDLSVSKSFFTTPCFQPLDENSWILHEAHHNIAKKDQETWWYSGPFISRTTVFK